MLKVASKFVLSICFAALTGSGVNGLELRVCRSNVLVAAAAHCEVESSGSVYVIGS